LKLAIIKLEDVISIKIIFIYLLFFSETFEAESNNRTLQHLQKEMGIASCKCARSYVKPHALIEIIAIHQR